jgi:hypothetical protein
LGGPKTFETIRVYPKSKKKTQKQPATRNNQPGLLHVVRILGAGLHELHAHRIG